MDLARRARSTLAKVPDRHHDGLRFLLGCMESDFKY